MPTDAVDKVAEKTGPVCSEGLSKLNWVAVKEHKSHYHNLGI